MARLGLSPTWRCSFANDICARKASAYRAYFGPTPELFIGDVASLRTSELPGRPDLVWASFPCQDLSLAGAGAGLEGKRSGTFRPFWRLVRGLVAEQRAPKIVVLENVVGTLTSHSGKDFASLVESFAASGYRVGAMIINAVLLLPQSRPRLFLVGFRGAAVPNGLSAAAPCQPWHPLPVARAYENLPHHLARNWVWWRLPVPHHRVPKLHTLIEGEPTGTKWHSKTETERLLRLMSSQHRKKVQDALRSGGRHVGTIYKRTRPNQNGIKVQRAEVRFDGISGCLRTPVGGSSRQTLIFVDKSGIRTRLLSPREAARLMGVPDDYPLPPNYNEAYHLFGDGVAVPVVRWLDEYLLSPLAGVSGLEQVA